MMAMQEALVRVINMHVASVDEDSGCLFFRRRSLDRIPMRTSGSHENLLWIEIRLEDMEVHVFNLERILHTKMNDLDWSKKIL
jgi:hypothetical protein